MNTPDENPLEKGGSLQILMYGVPFGFMEQDIIAWISLIFRVGAESYSETRNVEACTHVTPLLEWGRG